MTRLTSLIAVDKTPSRPDGEPLKLAQLPLNLPAGWDYAKLFGDKPQPLQSPGERRAETDGGKVQVAQARRPQPVVAPSPSTVTLPKTATSAELNMLIGAMLIAFSRMLLALDRRRISSN